MTTNAEVSSLDPALVRPGRVDRILAIDWAGAEQATQLFLRFYPHRPDLAQHFGQQIAGAQDQPCSPPGPVYSAQGRSRDVACRLLFRAAVARCAPRRALADSKPINQTAGVLSAHGQRPAGS